MYRDIDSVSLQDHRLFIRGRPRQVRLYNGSSDDFVGFGTCSVLQKPGTPWKCEMVAPYIRIVTSCQHNKRRPISNIFMLHRMHHIQRMLPESEVLKLHNFSPGTISWSRHWWLHHVLYLNTVVQRVTSTLDDQQEN